MGWKYLNGTQTAPAEGLSGAPLTFTMPATPGTYELRFFLNGSYTVLATSATITVAGAERHAERHDAWRRARR